MKRERRSKVGALLAMALVAALAGGCGGKKAPPTLAVTAEQKGPDVIVSMQTTGCELGKDCHAHLRLDGGPEVMPYEAQYIIPGVKPGKHAISVELSDQAHAYMGVKQLVDVDVK